ncbi:uncharacterized protein PpBr36_06679, partial [Pyricularia pennisetigena]|uniref:uncharacterized protein n=1 Tax=Pyricularia pennisetigena TaxID=1578925 RepID=UPI0011508068
SILTGSMSRGHKMTTIVSKRQSDAVADKVLRRAELGKIASKLQNRLALAKFKTTHGLEDLTLDSLEPKFEEERRRRQQMLESDVLSDSSSSASDLPYPSRTLMSSPFKAAPIFSDAIGSSNGSSAGYHRKRTYKMASFDHAASSPSKRFRSSPTPHRSSFGTHGFDVLHHGNSSAAWREQHLLAQSSPIKPKRQQHFTTSTGPDVALFKGSHRISEALATSPPPQNFAALSDDDDDLLPAHSFMRPGGSKHSRAASPPRTPPMRNRSLNRKSREANNMFGNDMLKNGNEKTGEEGADLLLYLAASPSPANPGTKRINRMDPPLTPPPKSASLAGALALPSSMMTTPGGGSLFPATPSQTFDFADFVNITPSPAPTQKAWRTPVVLGGGRTPLSVTRKRLTFDDC